MPTNPARLFQSSTSPSPAKRTTIGPLAAVNVRETTGKNLPDGVSILSPVTVSTTPAGPLALPAVTTAAATAAPERSATAPRRVTVLVFMLMTSSDHPSPAPRSGEATEWDEMRLSLD